MVEWARTTLWRQGHLLTEEAATTLNLKSTHPRPVVAVISHDCDLAATPAKEPNVEVILGRLIDSPDGNFAHAKNARKLHIPFINENRKQQWIELIATEKSAVGKTELAAFVPRTDLSLDRAGHSTLQQWLARRYRRAAFPDAFENRLKENGLQEVLTDILKPLGEQIVAIFFDVDNGQEAVRTDPADTYALRVYIAYATEPDPVRAQAAAEEIRDKIETAFRQKLFEPTQQWKYIELCECIAVSDEALTYRQSGLFKQWHLEYLSLREDPPGPMLKS
jgi:hypothetical protein